MINLVKNALRRPYTMAIAAMLIVLMGIISVSRMIVDIFPPSTFRSSTSPGASTASTRRTWSGASCW